jgi:starvation-inducible outer membrane lipoprotein
MRYFILLSFLLAGCSSSPKIKMQNCEYSKDDGYWYCEAVIEPLIHSGRDHD